MLDFVHEASRTSVKDNISARSRVTSRQIEARLIRADGKDLWVLWDAAAMFDGSRYAGSQ